MNILIIDDERTFNIDGAVYARNFNEALPLLKNKWDVVYLDHDLGDEATGYDICLVIEENAYNGRLLDIDKFVIHSMNPLGRMRMYQVLNRFYNVEFARVEDLL